jgi:hypothetical protein
LNICFDVFKVEAEAGADWGVEIFGVDGGFELGDEDDRFELVEVGDFAMWVAAEPGGVVHFEARRWSDVGVEGAGADGLAEGAAARAVGSAVVFGFADEGFVHEGDTLLI